MQLNDKVQHVYLVGAKSLGAYFLKLEIAKKAIGMILLLSTMHFGVMVMAYSLLVSTVTSMIINPRKTKIIFSKSKTVWVWLQNPVHAVL